MEDAWPRALVGALGSGLGYSCCTGMALFAAAGTAMAAGGRAQSWSVIAACPGGSGKGWANGPLATWNGVFRAPGMAGSSVVAGKVAFPVAASLLLHVDGRSSRRLRGDKMEAHISGKGQRLKLSPSQRQNGACGDTWRDLGKGHRGAECVVKRVQGGLSQGSKVGNASTLIVSGRGGGWRFVSGLGLGSTVWKGLMGLQGAGIGSSLAGGVVMSVVGALGDVGGKKPSRRTVVVRGRRGGGGGEGAEGEGGEGGGAVSSTKPRNSNSVKSARNRRKWTNILLGVNIVAFAAQVASRGSLLLWGAKVNSLIEAGQIWRLITPAVLHANIGHLLVNCYSLNSVGPAVEDLGGSRRFLAVYAMSAVAGSLASYRMCTSPSVGASGAIFGLVGALAVFFARHRRLLGTSGHRNLKSLSRVVIVNMLLGVASNGVDNWGHIGGLLGGAATAWFIGPALVLETTPGTGRKQLVDKPPLAQLFGAGNSSVAESN